MSACKEAAIKAWAQTTNPALIEGLHFAFDAPTSPSHVTWRQGAPQQRSKFHARENSCPSSKTTPVHEPRIPVCAKSGGKSREIVVSTECCMHLCFIRPFRRR